MRLLPVAALAILATGTVLDTARAASSSTGSAAGPGAGEPSDPSTPTPVVTPTPTSLRPAPVLTEAPRTTAPPITVPPSEAPSPTPSSPEPQTTPPPVTETPRPEPTHTPEPMSTLTPEPTVTQAPMPLPTEPTTTIPTNPTPAPTDPTTTPSTAPTAPPTGPTPPSTVTTSPPTEPTPPPSAPTSPPMAPTPPPTVPPTPSPTVITPPPNASTPPPTVLTPPPTEPTPPPTEPTPAPTSPTPAPTVKTASPTPAATTPSPTTPEPTTPTPTSPEPTTPAPTTPEPTTPTPTTPEPTTPTPTTPEPTTPTPTTPEPTTPTPTTPEPTMPTTPLAPRPPHPGVPSTPPPTPITVSPTSLPSIPPSTRDPLPPSSSSGAGSLGDGSAADSIVTPVPTSTKAALAMPSPSPTPTTAAPMSTLRRYQRSDEIIIVNKVLPNGTKVKVEVVVAPSQTPAVVIRGDSQTLDTADGVPDTKRDHAYIVLSYFCSALAGASLLLVLCLHFVSAQTPTQVVPSLRLPNQWELLAYMTYLQDMSSTGQYVVIAVPTYLWRFVDAFSWATLIPLHGHDSAIGYRFLGKNTDRRLSGTIVLDGLIAFADRVGIGEKQLLQSTVTTFLIGVGSLFVLAVAVVYYVKFVRGDDADAETDREMSDRESHTLAAHTVDIYGRQRSRWPILVVEGTTVAFFAFSLYPIMVMIIFEISSQIRARDTQGGALTIALIALVFACALFIFRTISSVRATRHVGEFRYGYRMVWGSLNSPDVIKYERRIQFVVAWFATQIMTALVVGSVRSEEWQLALLLAIDVAGVVGIMACNPFVDGLFAGIAVGVILVKAINTSLVFSFLSRGDLLASHRRATATAFVMLNAAILILWFLRLVWVAHGVWCSHFHPRRMSATSTATALGSPLRDPGDPDSPHYVPLLSADKSATCEDQ